MKKSAFTLTELVVAMVVITLVVTVTLPLTKRKMHKVDNFSYYLGYETAKSIAMDILPNTLANMEANACVVDIDGACFKQPFYSEPMTYEECAGENATSVNTETVAGTSAKSLGITSCYWSTDAWAGAVKACGGVKNLPSLSQLAKLAERLYPTMGTVNPDGYEYTYCPEDGDGNRTNCRDTEAALDLGFHYFTTPGSLTDDQSFYIWSNVEVSGKSAYNRWFETSYTYTYSTPYRNADSPITICLGSNETDDAGNLLENLEEEFNSSQSATTTTTPVTSVQTAATSRDFSSLTPHLTLTNGLRIYIGSDYAEIAELSDSVNENDRIGFIIYIDVNGKSGKSMLYEDIFPFYLVKSGKVIPGYNPAIASGPVSRDYMGVNVIFDSYTDGTRSVKLLLKDANFKKAACVAGYVTSATYCDGEVQYDVCAEALHDCRFVIKKPFRMF